MGFHNLVNTEYFREAAINYRKNGGRYTLAPIGSKDCTDYWDEQKRRCREGYSVGGLWIPGRYYFYLNFTPIWKVPDQIALKAYQEAKNYRGVISQKTASKILDFPRFAEMQYEWWNFKHIAWNGGSFMGINSPGGKHICCAKTRGAGFSYMEAADGIYNYNFIDGSKSYYFAGLEEYLIKDGILNKVSDGLDWINSECITWAQNRQKKDTMMHKKASYIDAYGEEHGSMSEIIGTAIDNPNKAHPYSTNVLTPQGYIKWADIHLGDYVYNPNGQLTEVIGEYEQGVQNIYNINFNDGRVVQATDSHRWEVYYWVAAWGLNKSVLKKDILTTIQLIERLKLKTTKINKLKVKLIDAINLPAKDTTIDPYTLGLMLGDGSIGNSTKNLSYLTMKWEDVEDIKHLIPYKVEKENWGGDIRNKLHIPNGAKLFKDLQLFDKRSGTKFIPDVYKFNSIKVRKAIIAGLLDTDGSITKDYGVVEYSTKSKRLAEDFTWVIRSLGYGGSIKERTINGTIYYRCYVYCKPNEKLFNLTRKQNIIAKAKKHTGTGLNKSTYVHIDSITYSHKELAKCIRVDAPDEAYVVEDCIRTLNTRGKRGRKATFEEAGSFKNLAAALEIGLGSMRDGDFYVGQVSVFGTGGEEGPSIAGLEEIFYNPVSWDMLAFPNIWENGTMDTCGYFVPCFRANFVYMDEAGNCDNELAIKSDNLERDKKKQSKDPRVLDRRKAEYPQKPGELFQRLNNNGFNVFEIDKQIRRLQTSKALQSLIRYGELVRANSTNSLCGVEFISMTEEQAKPILEYPHKQDGNLDGAFTIAERPYVDQTGKVPEGMYQIVFDPYYKEDAEDKTSLFAFYVLKQDNNIDSSFAGLPVAWWAGRPKKLSAAHDLLFKACDYYNCTAQGEIGGGGQGVIDYAKLKRLLHRLEFEPEMLHNKEMASKQKNKSYLMNMQTERKRLGISYLEDWHIEQRGVGEDGNPILTVHRIYDIMLLKEMRKFGTANADRISAMIIGMFMLKENITRKLEQKKSASDFFSRTLFESSYDVEEEVTTSY